MNFQLNKTDHLTLKRMASADSALVAEMSASHNNRSQDSNHPDDHFQSRYVIPGFKPFSYESLCSGNTEVTTLPFVSDNS